MSGLDLQTSSWINLQDVMLSEKKKKVMKGYMQKETCK